MRLGWGMWLSGDCPAALGSSETRELVVIMSLMLWNASILKVTLAGDT
jgi:hypothetical protein